MPSNAYSKPFSDYFVILYLVLDHLLMFKSLRLKSLLNSWKNENFAPFSVIISKLS